MSVALAVSDDRWFTRELEPVDAHSKESSVGVSESRPVTQHCGRIVHSSDRSGRHTSSAIPRLRDGCPPEWRILVGVPSDCWCDRSTHGLESRFHCLRPWLHQFRRAAATVPDGTTIPLLALSQGFGFATTSFRQNGLAILEGMEDITELMETLASSHGQLPTYMVGGSEGALVATLLVEQSEQFIGGLAACGPIGTFRGQIDYFGDFRALFITTFPMSFPARRFQYRIPLSKTGTRGITTKSGMRSVANAVRADELLRVAHVTHPLIRQTR